MLQSNGKHVPNFKTQMETRAACAATSHCSYSRLYFCVHGMSCSGNVVMAVPGYKPIKSNGNPGPSPRLAAISAGISIRSPRPAPGGVTTV